jgi:capsular exopolysaccharide synthesis family protein
MVDYTPTALTPASRPLAVLRRRKWIVIACILVAGAVAYAISANEQKKYTATGGLLFQTAEFSQQLFGFTAATGSQDPTTAQATDVALVSEPIVALDAAKSLGHPFTARRVARETSVAPAGASSIVNVHVSDRSPTKAAMIANAYAQAFVAYETAQNVAQVAQAENQMQAQITRVQAVTPLNSELPALKQRLSQLEALATLQTGDVQISETALRPQAPSSPHVSREVALGLLAGILIGLLAAFLAERVDRALRDPDEVKALLGLPILGMIPSNGALGRRSAVPLRGDTPEAEAFRLLRAQLRYFNVDREIRSVLVTSAVSGDGKSTVAWNLARTAALLAPYSSVLAVDADLRRPRIAELAGEPALPGLAELLTQSMSVEDVIRSVDVSGAGPPAKRVALNVITGGDLAPNPTELIESQKLREVLEKLDAQHDFVVIDAPPTAIVSDAIPLMGQVSGVLVVVRLRHTRRDALRALRDQLDRLGAPCLGVVLNDVKFADTGYGGYSRYPSSRAERRSRTPRAAPPLERPPDVGSPR